MRLRHPFGQRIRGDFGYLENSRGRQFRAAGRVSAMILLPKKPACSPGPKARIRVEPGNLNTALGPAYLDIRPRGGGAPEPLGAALLDWSAPD